MSDTFFQWEQKFSRGNSHPSTPSYGLTTNHFFLNANEICKVFIQRLDGAHDPRRSLR